MGEPRTKQCLETIARLPPPNLREDGPDSASNRLNIIHIRSVIGGVEDHVHALFSLSKNYALKKIVEEVKKGSSKWMKTDDGSGNRGFQWQFGYAGFSVSQSQVPDVTHYIESQAEHHRRMTFQDELRTLFRRHGIEFDERYVWD